MLVQAYSNYVTSCWDCPFTVDGPRRICRIKKEPVLRVGQPSMPAWCPLREGAVVVQLGVPDATPA